jgi:hypothetical protein
MVADGGAVIAAEYRDAKRRSGQYCSFTKISSIGTRPNTPSHTGGVMATQAAVYFCKLVKIEQRQET